MLSEHGNTRYLISRDFLITGPNIVFIDTAENVLQNAWACSLIVEGFALVQGAGPAAQKKFMAILATMNIKSDFGTWKVFRENQPAPVAAESIAE